MAGYTRQSSYTDGDIINAADSNDEFDQLVNVFSNTTGHKHDGTAAEGPVIGLIGDPGVTTPINKVVVDDTNNRVGFFVDVSSVSTEQIRVQDGAIVPVTDNDIDLGASGAEFKDLYIDGTANIDTIDADAATIDSLTITSGTAITSIDTDISSVSASDDTLASAKAIKTYIDAQITAQDLDFQGDSGGALSIDLDSETLDIAGGTGIDTSGSGNTLTVAIDSTVATLAGTQTLTNKTLTTPVIASISNTGTLTLPTSTDTLVGRATTDTLTNKTIDVDNNTVSNIEVDNLKTGVLDTDLTSVAATDTTLASAKAIKTYVDSQVTAQDLDFQADTGGALSIDLDSETMTFTGGTGIDTSGAGNAVTFAIDSTVATLTGAQTLTNKSIDASQLTGTVANARLDTELQALAGLTSAANKGIQFTGSGTAGTFDLTTAGKALLDDADASAQRTTLGVAIGTDVQGYDAGLASIAGLTTAADKAIYTTASDTYAVTDLTSFGRSLIDDTDAATARTTLGVVIGTNVQAYDAQLDDIAGLTPTDGNFIVGDGANFVSESGATARTSLGLGTAATQDVGTSANNVVQLDGTGKLPAVDGSQLTNITVTETDPSALAFAIALG